MVPRIPQTAVAIAAFEILSVFRVLGLPRIPGRFPRPCKLLTARNRTRVQLNGPANVRFVNNKVASLVQLVSFNFTPDRMLCLAILRYSVIRDQ
jgi:hypothetical protein